MEAVIEAIRCAVAGDATSEARASGAQACRTLLTALETPQGAPLATAVATSVAPVPPNIGALVGALRQLPPEQLLDLAIARLRAALPSDASVPTVPRMQLQLVPLGNLATTRQPTGDRS